MATESMSTPPTSSISAVSTTASAQTSSRRRAPSAVRAGRGRRTKAELARAASKKTAARKHHLKTTHNMTPQAYAAIKAFQGGYCPVCLRATGRTKELANDHDHNRGCHPGPTSCALCWRGLLCSTCNRMLAHARDSIEFFYRAIEYLNNPPAQRWLHSIHDWNMPHDIRHEAPMGCPPNCPAREFLLG